MQSDNPKPKAIWALRSPRNVTPSRVEDRSFRIGTILCIVFACASQTPTFALPLLFSPGPSATFASAGGYTAVLGPDINEPLPGDFHRESSTAVQSNTSMPRAQVGQGAATGIAFSSVSLYSGRIGAFAYSPDHLLIPEPGSPSQPHYEASQFSAGAAFREGITIINDINGERGPVENVRVTIPIHIDGYISGGPYLGEVGLSALDFSAYVQTA